MWFDEHLPLLLPLLSLSAGQITGVNFRKEKTNVFPGATQLRSHIQKEHHSNIPLDPHLG